MLTFFRWGIRIATGMVVLVSLLVLLVYWFASRSLPDYNRDVAVSGIGAPVEIVRDNANVPHIFGQSDADVFFGLGFAHAQDRLWQMVMLRRTLQGRLSEIFGPRTVEIDKLLRRYDLYTAAQQSVSAQDARTQEILLAYSAGVNARVTQVAEEALGRGAPEMFLFNQPIAPWTPADSLAVLKAMALQLQGGIGDEVLRARVSLILSDPNRLLDIIPDMPGVGIAALPDYASLVPEGAPVFADNALDIRNDPLSPIKPSELAGASNAWAAGPHRSSSGGTLLANDPHLGLSAPTIWYLARLELSTGGVIGGTIPGLPAILSGRSDALAWGVTSSYLDDVDIFMEELNPENPEEYRTPTGWAQFKSRPSIITIKGAEPITLTLRWTENGPVLPGTQYDLETVTPPGHVAAVSWVGLDAQDTTMTAAIRMMAAQTVQEAISAGQLFVAPAQNLTLADKQQIALKLVGRMPRRDANHQSQGRMPSLGWRSENRWQGYFPYTANPEFVDPVGGIVGNTNNKIVERPFPAHVSFDWGDSQRIQRWQRLMQGRRVHTRDSFIEGQLDTVSVAAQTLLALVGAELWFTGEAAPEGTPERLRQRALTLLANWNGEMNEHMPEPLLYMAWMRELQEKLILDELGPLSKEFTHVEPLFIERVFRNVEGAGAWCDVVQSSPQETCTEIARQALDEALLRLTERYGSQIESYRWGDVHMATHDHQVLGEVPVLRHFVNIRQSTSGGDNTLNRAKTSGKGTNPYLNVHAAGIRTVVDMMDPNSSVFVTATGQSGHFLSRHYDDLGELWRRGEYIPMSLDPDLARAAPVGITQLTPR